MVGDRPAAVTWCPLCGSAVVYAAGIDGRRFKRAPARRLIAFAWRDDHGEDACYTG